MARFTNHNGKTIKSKLSYGKKRATFFTYLPIEEEAAAYFKQIAKTRGLTYSQLLKALMQYNGNTGNSEVPQYLDRIIRNFFNNGNSYF
jgi:hypothetical protein